MQVSVEESSVLERRLTVEIPEERIADQVASRLNDMRKRVRIDGFRQGKAPLNVVRQRFGKAVRDEVVGEVLQSTFSEAMSQQALKPAGQPAIDSVDSEPGSGLTYTATFEVFPEFELKPLEELEIERLECEIGDADVDAMIEKLREQNREWVAVERAAADGDQLAIDFRGTIDGEVFEGGEGEDFDIQLGSGMMIDGFEDGLRGKSAGDAVELDLEFPADYRNETLAGKPVRFEITVKRVSEPVLPEVDAEFIKKFGIEDGDVDAFRAEVRKNMETERERTLRQRFNGAVMDQLAAANDFEVPKAMIKAEAEQLGRQVAQEMMMRGLNPGDNAAGFGEMVQQRATSRVKLGLIMAEIIKQAELKADPDKVRGMIEKMASSYEDAAAVVKYYYDNPEQLQQVEALCLEDEAVNWVAEKARITEKTVSFDALMNPVQTATEAEASS
ncbi:MAG: trigger factor [Gammaproteobacteria bacterium]